MARVAQLAISQLQTLSGYSGAAAIGELGGSTRADNPAKTRPTRMVGHPCTIVSMAWGIGVLAGWLILDEPLTPPLLIALMLVAAGIYLVNRKRSATL